MRGTGFYIFAIFFVSRARFSAKISRQIMEQNSSSSLYLGGVYMRKLAPARVSYRHDFLMSYRVYMITGSFHISLFEGTLHVDKMHV